MGTASAIEIKGPPPSAELAAAIVAAIERFTADVTPATARETQRVDAWFRAGILEATGNDLENPFQSPAGH